MSNQKMHSPSPGYPIRWHHRRGRRLWALLYPVATRLGLGLGMHQCVTRTIHWLAGRSLVQRFFLVPHKRWIDRLIREIDLPENKREETVAQVLAEFMKRRVHYDEVLVENLGEDHFRQLFSSQDQAHLDRAHAGGRGVILVVSKTAVQSFVLLSYLQSLPMECMAVGGGTGRLLRGQGKPLDHVDGVFERLRHLQSARQVLSGSGVVVLPPGGGHGSRTMEQTLLGRRHLYRTGFAELALATGAPVMPVVALKDSKGRFFVRYHAPLDPGRPDWGQGGRVIHLVRQYAAFEESLWRTSPKELRLRDIVEVLGKDPVAWKELS